MTHDLYDVSAYSDEELFDILELDNPSDRVLEAKILSMVHRYDSMEGEEAELLSSFFIDIYTRFFDTEIDYSGSDSDSSDIEEGFVGYGVEGDPTSNVQTYTQGGYRKDESMNIPYADMNAIGNIQTNQQGDRYSGGYGGKGYAAGGNANTAEYSQKLNMGGTYGKEKRVLGNNVSYSNFVGNTEQLDEKGDVILTKNGQGPRITQSFDASKVVNRGTLKTKDDSGKPLDNTQLTKQIDYSKDVLNPLLKQTIKRVISIDSQYRENKQSSSTEFTFNLSEPLKDVVSLKLYSIQIPFTWYTINGSFGGNFFFIKGNSPGIDNGDHDHKIEIPSGNYTASSLIAYLNSGIQSLKETILDVSFGTTSITYNPNSVLSTITIDMKEIFGESHYYLEFPTLPTPTSDPRRNTTLAGFLGYHNQLYDVCTVFSNYISNTRIAQPNVSIPVNTTIQIKTYTVGNTATEDYSIPGDSYVEYGNISIPVPARTNVTISDVVSDINAEFLIRSEFDPLHSFVRLVDSGLSDNTKRIQMNIKWKRSFIQSVEFLKTAVILPSELVGNTSAFQFPSTINETSHLISEEPMLKSKYIIEPSANIIQFECIHPGYTTPPFNYNIVLPASSGNGYKLEEYIQTINDAIETQNINGRLTGTSIYTVMDTSYVNMNVCINKVFTNQEYTITFIGSLIANLFNQPVGVEMPLGNTVFTTSTHDPEYAVEIDGSTNKILIRSTIDRTLEYAITFRDLVSFDVPEVIEALYTDITNYTIVGEPDEYNQKPFKTSLVTFDDITNLSTIRVQINVSQRLISKDYKLKLISTQIPNTWNTYLRFDSSYNLNDVNPNPNIENPIITIPNNQPVYDNQITLNSTNNYFVLKSFSEVNGLTYQGAGLYDVSINITPTIPNANNKYTADEIFDAINARLAENPITAGTIIRTTGPEYSGKTMLRVNINKAFRTQDFRLVFYDPYSFVSCYSGASKSGSKSVQNATWDTTVGWILGFRESIIYYLDSGDYIQASSSERIHYNADKTICTLTGDTTVSTSLYNYFLIALDDYTQNHLNDGLVTITTQQTSIDVGPYTYMCNPYNTTGSTMIAVPISDKIKTDNGKITGISQKELYTFNEKLLSKQVKEKSYSKGPFVKDIFGIIPIKTAGLLTGSTYVEFGGTLQNQERMYFGPVNIHRMTIRLLNDRGDMVDLNNANWSFSLVCEQLYRS